MTMTVEDYDVLIAEMVADRAIVQLPDIGDSDAFTAGKEVGYGFALYLVQHKRQRLIEFNEKNETVKKSAARAWLKSDFACDGLSKGSAAKADEAAEIRISKMSDDEVMAELALRKYTWDASSGWWVKHYS